MCPVSSPVWGGERAVIFDRLRQKVLPVASGEGTHFIIPFFQKANIFSIRSTPRSIPVVTGSKGAVHTPLHGKGCSHTHTHTHSHTHTHTHTRTLVLHICTKCTSHHSPTPCSQQSCVLHGFLFCSLCVCHSSILPSGLMIKGHIHMLSLQEDACRICFASNLLCIEPGLECPSL